MASHSSATSRGKRRRFAPRLEMMEDRSLLAPAAPGLLDPLLVPKFVNPLPIPGVYTTTDTTNVTLADGTPAQNVPLYHVGAFQIEENLGLGLIDPTTHDPIKTKVYGYGTSAGTATFPGGTFVVKSGSPIAVQWTNGLVDATDPAHTKHLLPVDPTVMETTTSSDTTMSGLYYNATLQNNKWDVTFPTGIPMVAHVHGGHTQAIYDGTPLEWFTPLGAQGEDFPGTTTFTYDNSQQAGTIWYHDHAIGVTRLNVYAGLAGFYITHDDHENSLITTDTVSNVLPNEQFDIPLAIQDRMFTTDGQLYYPADVLPGTTAKFPSVHPEVFGDTILVNGQAWPVLDVDPRMYRFRILNGSNSRFYDLYFDSGQRMMQIGTDDGLLAQPVALSHLTIAPGERADVVIDFSKLKGQTLILRNDAKGPFPSGTAADPRTVGQIMEFRVRSTNASPIPDATLTKDTTLNTINPLVPTPGVPARQLGLFEKTDEFGRLIQMVGAKNPDTNVFSATPYLSTTTNPITVVKQDDTEEWQVFNTTEDTHPIHLHQVMFQIVSRQNFTWTVDPDTGGFTVTGLKGPLMLPAANEAGWKDTVQMNPGEVTIIRAKFDLTGKYVWHCHILEHEEHDMMNEYEVVPATLVSSQPAAQLATSSSIVPNALALAPNVAAVSPDPATNPIDPLAAEVISPTKNKRKK